MDIPQAFEEIAVFNHSKKYFLCNGDFQRRSYIFCAAVDNEKRLSSVQKSHRCNQRGRPRQRRICAAIGKEKSDAKQKPYMASVGHACRKMVSIIYAVMRDNKAYTPCIPNEISA